MIRHHHRITHAAAVTLALTALVAPPALAMPAPASPGPCSEVCSNAGYGLSPTRPAAAPVSTQPRSQITSTAPCSEVCSDRGNGSRLGGPATTPTSTGLGPDVSSTNSYRSVRVPATVVPVTPSNHDFDWGDAGIGAGAALGLMLAAIGGTLLLARRRTQSPTAS